jgi:hypothetical protein
LTTTLSAIRLSSIASVSMLSRSVATTSALTSPSTSAQMPAIISRNSRPSLAASVGFVVTPSSTPQALISVMSSRLAVSRKSLTVDLTRVAAPVGGVDVSSGAPDSGWGPT